MTVNRVEVKKADINVRAVLTALTHAKKVKVGYPVETTGGAVHTDSNLPMATLAAIHELGRGRVPPRPFMRQGGEIFAQRRGLIVPQLKHLLTGKRHVDAFMITCGFLLKGAIDSAVKRQAFVPLAPATVEQKGSSEILVDTGELLDKLSVHLER